MRQLPPTALAQVDTVFPATGTLSVVFPHLAMLSGVPVRVAVPGASARTGEFRLPRRGDWGVVAFYQNDPRSCVWLVSLPDNVWNAMPNEVWAADPLARVTYGEDGSQRVAFSNGDREVRYGDGTLLRVSHSKDGTLSNAGGRVKVTARKVTQPQGEHRAATRAAYAAPALPPADLVIRHVSGTTALISADGAVTVTTAKGHRLRLYDATEKARSASDGSVSSAPDEDASRAASEVELRTEMGHTLLLHDDPLLSSDRYMKFTSAGGHSIELRDKPDAQKHVQVKTAGGHTLTLTDLPAAQKGANVTTAAGLSVDLNDQTGKATVTAIAEVIVSAPVIRLGSAGASRKVVLDGDTGTDPQGGSVTVRGTTTKVYGE